MEKEEIKEEVKEEKKSKKERKTKKALVTCRVLFISALDKIMFVVLALAFIGALWANFRGNFSSPNYGYWRRVLGVIALLIGGAIEYFIMNWFYKCAAKTMLCITEDEVYKEAYIPFKRTEKSIPLNKITSVTTINLFWIFRSLIIFQYHQLPTIFFTWKNQEFKDKFDELVNKRTEQIENEFEDKSIISFLKEGFVKKFFICLAALIVFLGVIRLFGVFFSPAKKVPGTYVNGDNKIVLSKDGTCDVSSLQKDTTSCTWELNSEGDYVSVNYSYKYNSWLFGETTNNASKQLKYEDKKLVDGSTEYVKE